MSVFLTIPSFYILFFFVFDVKNLDNSEYTEYTYSSYFLHFFFFAVDFLLLSFFICVGEMTCPSS